MSEKKVKIIYTDRNLAAKFSTKPVSVTPGHAANLVSLGFARILQDLPKGNPAVEEKELDEIKKRYEEDSVSYVLEEKLLTKIVWLCGGIIDRELRRIGTELGFRISVVNSVNFSIGKLLFADVIIISSNLEGFSEAQKVHIRAIVFQKNVPFIFRLENDCIENEHIKHFMMDSKLNLFANDELFTKTIEVMGEMLDDSEWFIETGDAFDLWRKVNSVFK